MHCCMMIVSDVKRHCSQFIVYIFRWHSLLNLMTLRFCNLLFTGLIAKIFP
jgi:hypothetical protein